MFCLTISKTARSLSGLWEMANRLDPCMQAVQCITRLLEEEKN